MPDDPNRIIRFPQSRVPGTSKNRGFEDLGLSDRAKSIDSTGRGTHGHWCSYCAGIWFGQAGEVECPRCGNRHG